MYIYSYIRWSWLIIFFTYTWLFLPGFLGHLICVLLHQFYWVSLFQCHFSHGCYDCGFWWLFPLLCVLFCISPRPWVILEVSGDLFCSAEFLPCMYCVFSFFQLSLQILLSPGHHFHLFQLTAWWLRLGSFPVLFTALSQMHKRVLSM